MGGDKHLSLSQIVGSDLQLKQIYNLFNITQSQYTFLLFFRRFLLMHLTIARKRLNVWHFLANWLLGVCHPYNSPPV